MFLFGYSRQILGSASVWLTWALWDVFNIASIERSVLKWLGWKGKSGWSPGVTLQDMESYPGELFSDRQFDRVLLWGMIWAAVQALFFLSLGKSQHTHAARGEREESECPEPTEIDLELPFTELEWYAEFKFNTNYSQQTVCHKYRRWFEGIRNCKILLIVQP